MLIPSQFHAQVNTNTPGVLANQSPSFQRASVQESSIKSPEGVASSQDMLNSFDSEQLVNQLYQQIQDRIAARGQLGQDSEQLWQQAKEGIAQGFAEAKDILHALNPQHSQLDSKIDYAQQQLFDAIDHPEQRALVEKSYQKASSSQQQFSLQLTTKQGDEVTIFVNNQQSQKVDNQTSGFSMSSLSQQDVFWQIEGDINAQEQKDIEQLFSNISKLGQQFYAGDMQTAFNMAQELSIDHTSLQQMQLNMHQYEQHTLTQPIINAHKQAVNSYEQVQMADKPWMQINEGQTKLLQQLTQWLQESSQSAIEFERLFEQADSILPAQVADYVNSN